jgi:hypothetical protein
VRGGSQGRPALPCSVLSWLSGLGVTGPGPCCDNVRMRTRRGGHGSILSIGSSGSILSIGSTGSILSIGSAGSILSIGSAGSLGSAFSIGSLASAGSVLSGLSLWSVRAWRSDGRAALARARSSR